MSADADIALVRGRPGTAQEGRTFFAVRLGSAAVAVIEAAGAAKLGARGDRGVWSLPAGMDEAGAAGLLETALAAAAPARAPAPPPAEAATETPAGSERETAAPVATTAAPGLEATATTGGSTAVSQDPVDPGPTASAAPASLATEAPDDLPAAPEAAGTASAAVARDDATAVTSRAVVQPGPAAAGEVLPHGHRLAMSIAERDRFRRPVLPGTVRVGDVVEVDGTPREIVMLSGTISYGADIAAQLRRRFPGLDIPFEDGFQFAMWRAEPIAASAPETVPEPAPEAVPG